ncbi:hypothetical protein ACFV9C_12955 [Kribbella sp. NPDC059898]|uniref:hypothetical protein n=1 Tax=Kribbella sp. NPDC059898 TaxID=3346995 RepID=UPI00365B5EDB
MLLAGWKTLPLWSLIPDHDKAIAPAAQRFRAERMRATTVRIAGSHSVFIARPVVVAQFVLRALDG